MRWKNMEKKSLLAIMAMVMSLSTTAQKIDMDQFISNLMNKMTVEEKIGQLNLLPAGTITTGISKNSSVIEVAKSGQLGGILSLKGADNVRELQEVAVKQSRLGIPIIFGMDVIHGYETIFPIPLALSCSWNIPAIENAARIAAKEASADGICWVYSPMVDISLDARWGRIAEGSGEDPFLGSAIAQAFVRGYQGDFKMSSGKFKEQNVMACLKHYALYGASESGLDYNTVDMSRQRMYNQYLAPYKAAVEAGVGSVMTSFNLVDGIPATANRWLLNDVLRNDWKFDGFVVTDYGSISEMCSHGIGDTATCAKMALQAGTDMDMCAEAFTHTLKASLDAGQICMNDIDAACRRILEAKWRLGLFDDPYRYCNPKRRATDIYTDENRKAARDLAAETFVLLKNEGDLLPLKKKGTIALIGPLADNRANIPGTWAPTAVYKQYKTLRQSMAEYLDGKATLLCAQGCNFCSDADLQEAGSFYRITPRVDDDQAMAEAIQIAQQADVIVCAMGEEEQMSGESASRANLELFDVQRELLERLSTLDKPIVLLNFAGRPTVMKWESEHIPAIMNVWFAGSETGDAICDVLFGDKCPSGRLTVSMPQATGQEPLYYNHLPTGRPMSEGNKKFAKFRTNYLDATCDALYPFGFGLSYTTFHYDNLRLSCATMPTNGSLTASIDVTNTGSRDADEVVQLYLHDVYASISRPVKELKGFRRIHLKAGETQTVTFTVTPDLLAFYDYHLRQVVESGTFELMIGPDSSDKHLTKATFEVK